MSHKWMLMFLIVAGITISQYGTATAGYEQGDKPEWEIVPSESTKIIYSGGEMTCWISGWNDKDDLTNAQGGVVEVDDSMDTNVDWLVAGDAGWITDDDSDDEDIALTADFPPSDKTFTVGATVNDMGKYGGNSKDDPIHKDITITLKAITVASINWSVPSIGDSGTDATTAVVPVGATVYFSAIATPVDFPSGKPVWSDAFNATGKDVSHTFNYVGEYKVKATCGNSKTVTVRVVKVAQVAWPAGDGWSAGSTTTSTTLTVPKGATVTFTATPGPTSGWPKGKPAWNAPSPSAIDGAAITVTFGTVSASLTDYKTVTAECGNTVTVNVLVVGVAKIEFRNEANTDWVDLTDKRIMWWMGRPIRVRALPAPTGATWPTGKPAWTGTFGVTGIAEERIAGAAEASTDDSDFKSIIAECGDTKTGEALCCNLRFSVHTTKGPGITFTFPTDMGHAWVVNCDLSSGSAVTTFHGLWPDDHPDYLPAGNNGAGWDIRDGREATFASAYDRYYLLKPSQRATLAACLSANVTWTEAYNCSSWASGTTQTVTGETVSAADSGYLWVADTPRGLGNSINTLEQSDPTEASSPKGHGQYIP